MARTIHHGNWTIKAAAIAGVFRDPSPGSGIFFVEVRLEGGPPIWLGCVDTQDQADLYAAITTAMQAVAEPSVW